MAAFISAMSYIQLFFNQNIQRKFGGLQKNGETCGEIDNQRCFT